MCISILYNLFIYGCAGSLLLHELFSLAASRSYSPVAVQGFLVAVVPPLVEHGLCGAHTSVIGTHGLICCGSSLYSIGSVVVAHGLSCSAVCGIFPDQGWNLSPTLAGRFFTTELPRKPLHMYLKSHLKMH